MKTLKAAGVTPIVVGGADKWPLHFYWTHLAVRIGGKPAFDAALRGENGGFAGETFQKSGELFKQLVDLQPFQNGFLGFKNPQAVGYFGDGKAAMTLAISSVYHLQRALAADKVGIERRQDRLVRLSGRARRQGRRRPIRSAASPAGSSPRAAPKEAVDFLKYFISKDVQTRLAAGNFIIPVVQGRGGRPQQRLHEARSPHNLAKSNYHQNFYDQSLGPSVGRVVNDVTAEIAGGSMTPQAGGQGDRGGLEAGQLSGGAAGWRARRRSASHGVVLAAGRCRAAARCATAACTVVILFLPPALLLFTLFVVLPIGEAAWYSAFNWNGFGRPTNWVGFDNYRFVLRNPRLLAGAAQQRPDHRRSRSRSSCRWRCRWP